MPYTIPEWAKRPPDASTPRLASSYGKAPGKDLTPLPGTLDKENGSAVFSGRHGNYETTLTSCPCGSNPKPCKHMYRLAMELGIMSGDLSICPTEAENRYAANETGQVSLREAVSELENLDEPSQLFLKNALSPISDIGSAPVRMRIPEEARRAVSFPYLSFSPVSASDIMDAMRKKDITAILDRLNIHPDGNLKKSDLIPWCIQNIPTLSDELPEEYYIACLPCFRRVIKKILIYLRRKFDWNGYYDGNMEYKRYPFGAVPDDMNFCVMPDGSVQTGSPCGYRFPVDEITELLTLHGYNRCLNGFDSGDKEGI